MLPYIITFSLSLYFAYCATTKTVRNNKKVYYICCTLTILFPTILAAVRDTSIGSDVRGYVISIWNDSIMEKEDFYKMIIRYPHIEIFYLYLNCLCAKLSNSLSFFLFIVQVLIMLPIFISAMHLKRIVSPVVVLFLYYCFIYNDTYNMVRQSIALSVFLLAISYLLKDQKKLFLLFNFIALGFHTSAILGFLFLPLYIYVKRFPIKDNVYTYVSILWGICILLCFIDSILITLINWSVFDAKYLAYTSMGNLFEARISKSLICLKIFVFFFFFWIIYKRKASNHYIDFFFIVSIIDIGLGLTGLIVSFLARIACYTQIISCISISYFFLYNRSYLMINKKRFLIPVKFLCYSFFVFYWYFTYVLAKTSETYPYTSKILSL